MFRKISTCCLLALIIAASLRCLAQNPPAQRDAPANAARESVLSSANEFIRAFNSGDAKAIAALWTPGGRLIDEQGKEFIGRPAIEEQYAALFESDPGAWIKLKINSITNSTPSNTLEKGIAIVTRSGGGMSTASEYEAEHVFKDGKWLMASVRESPVDLKPILEPLAWLVGEWQNKSGDTTVQSSIRWIANKEFLQRDYQVQKGAETLSSGTQIIGWDHQVKQVRSWSFDSSGGRGAGVWTPTEDGWMIETTGTLANGTPTASTDYLICVVGENNVFGWQSTNRRAGSTNLLDTKELVMERVSKK